MSRLFTAKNSISLIVRNVSAVRAMASLPSYKTIAVSSPYEFVVHVELNRPDKRNAMNRTMWNELGECFTSLADNPDCRVVVLSGAGEKSFTAGLDLQDTMSLGMELAQHEDIARKCNVMLRRIREYQNGINPLELCPKPIIAAVHGDCIGAGVDIIAATDIRFCTKDTYFQVKEVDIGMAADVGTLQRLPRILGNASLVNELIYTGRKLSSEEAKQSGLISDVYDSKKTLLSKTFELASTIAAKSPVAIQTTKRNLIYSRDHTVAEGLEHIALNNMAMLQSEDFVKAITAQATRDGPPVFAKL